MARGRISEFWNDDLKQLKIMHWLGIVFVSLLIVKIVFKTFHKIVTESNIKFEAKTRAQP